jgi:5-methylcytosine-specific restriction endonuclease McrA
MDEDFHTPEIISRKDAKARGLNLYFTGKPCVNGHIAKRYIWGCNCLGCAQAYMGKLKIQSAERRSMIPLSPRKQAMAEGRNRYFSDVPCPLNHNAERLTSNGSCVECHRINAARRSEEDQEIKDSIVLYRRDQAELYKSHVRNRRHKLKTSIGSHDATDIERLWDKQKGRCTYCSVMLADGYHVDHRMPISLGGSNGPENLQLTCQPCNLKKHNKHPDEFEKQLRIPLNHPEQ